MTAMRLVCLGLGLILALSPANVKAQDPGCVAAECVPPGTSWPGTFGGFSNGSYRPGQIFAPLFGGVLREVRLGLEASRPSDTTRVVIQIRTVQGGFPTSVVLGEAIVPGGPFVNGTLYTGSFAGQGMLLESGTEYAITLRTTGGNVALLAQFPGCDPSTGSINPVHTYDGGATWGYAWSPGERSMIYQVCVDAATPAVRSSWGRVKTLYR
jgi:hypothetical protein